MNWKIRQTVIAAITLIVVGTIYVDDASAQRRWRRARCCAPTASNNCCMQTANACCGQNQYGGSIGYGGAYAAQPMNGGSYTSTGCGPGSAQSGVQGTPVYGNSHTITDAQSRTFDAPAINGQSEGVIESNERIRLQQDGRDSNRLDLDRDASETSKDLDRDRPEAPKDLDRDGFEAPKNPDQRNDGDPVPDRLSEQR